jgi:hypothetical protein
MQGHVHTPAVLALGGVNAAGISETVADGAFRQRPLSFARAPRIGTPDFLHALSCLERLNEFFA